MKTSRREQLYAKTLTSANTEYSQVLPAWVKSFSAVCRTDYDVRIAYVTGKVGASTDPYKTIPAGCEFEETGLLGGGSVPMTIYLASSQAGVVVEITASS
jgi:hypothetical protein